MVFFGPDEGLPVVSVSYREKIRVDRLEKKIFFNIFFMMLADLSTQLNNCDNTSHFGTPYDQPATTRRKLNCMVNHVEKVKELMEENRVVQPYQIELFGLSNPSAL